MVGTLLAKVGSVVMASILATGRVYKGMPTRFQHEIFKPLQPAVGHRNRYWNSISLMGLVSDQMQLGGFGYE